MPDQSEAACLLQTGRAYPHRLGLRDGTGSLVFFGLRPSGFSAYRDDAPIFHFDLDGRWQRAFVDGVHAIKDLDGSVRTVERPREDGNLTLRRQTLAYAEASDWDASVRDFAVELLADLASGRLQVEPPPASAAPIAVADLSDLLERVAAWDAAAWFARRERYAATYGPLPFLPPNLHGAIVLQKTLGHAGGRAFGGAPAAPHAVRTPAEFAEHAEAVRGLIGRRIAQAGGLFLAGADFLRLDPDEVVHALETARERFEGGKDLTARAFLDDPGVGLPDAATWARFGSAGLRQVSVGIDLDPAKDSMGQLEMVAQTLRANLRNAGIGIVLVMAVDPVRDSARIDAVADRIGRIGLGAGEVVMVVDRRQLAAGDGDADDAGRPDADGLEDWVAAIRRAVSPGPPAKGAAVVPYNPRRQRD